MQVNLPQSKATDSSFTHSPECRGKATARVSLLVEGARHQAPERGLNLDLPAQTALKLH